MATLPSEEFVKQELKKAKSIEDFFGKNGIFSKLFADTLTEMMEEEMQAHLGYEKHAKGKAEGNHRNGSYKRKLKSSFGETEVDFPRDRQGEFESQLLPKYQTSSNEIEKKIIAMYSRGMTTRDISAQLEDVYGMKLSAGLISQITEKVLPLVEEWQNRPLEAVYPIVYLDAIHMKIRLEGKVEARAVYHCLGIDQEGRKDILGQWVSDGSEGANFWLSVITDLQSRGVKDILIACVDGLKGFREAINSVFPQTVVQPCIIHKIRNSLRYVSWKDKKAFMADLKLVYKAPTKSAAEVALDELEVKWQDKYMLSVRKWREDWDNLTQYFDYPAEIRRIIYTTNIIEGYHRQIRKATKTKSVFPDQRSAAKMLYLATDKLRSKWTKPIPHWYNILNQLAIRFEGRLPL